MKWLKKSLLPSGVFGFDLLSRPSLFAVVFDNVTLLLVFVWTVAPSLSKFSSASSCTLVWWSLSSISPFKMPLVAVGFADADDDDDDETIRLWFSTQISVVDFIVLSRVISSSYFCITDFSTTMRCESSANLCTFSDKVTCFSFYLFDSAICLLSFFFSFIFNLIFLLLLCRIGIDGRTDVTAWQSNSVDNGLSRKGSRITKLSVK